MESPIANINVLGVKSEMANPDNSGCTGNFADGYLPWNSNSQQAPGQDVLLKLRFPNVVFKENDNFQRRILNGQDKPEYGGGQNKNDARLGEEKKKTLPDIVLALSLKLTPRTYTVYQLYMKPESIFCWQLVWIWPEPSQW